MIPEFTAAIALVGQAVRTAKSVVETTSDLNARWLPHTQLET
jgi:hypothetical protein